MKKTLFAMAALALCGTAFAETKTYYATAFEGSDFSADVYGEGSDVVFNVNETVTLDWFILGGAKSATLNFAGASTLSASMADLEVNFRDGTLAITGDNEAKIYWGGSLTSSAGVVTTLTLVSADLYPPHLCHF